ncbi:hypothetical protein ES703_104857 [subsurface metagenome]
MRPFIESTIQLYNGDKKTLIESLERIQKTASEILEAVMIDKESECETAGGESRVAVAISRYLIYSGRSYSLVFLFLLYGNRNQKRGGVHHGRLVIDVIYFYTW